MLALLYYKMRRFRLHRFVATTRRNRAVWIVEDAGIRAK